MAAVCSKFNDTYSGNGREAERNAAAGMQLLECMLVALLARHCGPGTDPGGLLNTGWKPHGNARAIPRESGRQSGNSKRHATRQGGTLVNSRHTLLVVLGSGIHGRQVDGKAETGRRNAPRRPREWGELQAGQHEVQWSCRTVVPQGGAVGMPSRSQGEHCKTSLGVQWRLYRTGTASTVNPPHTLSAEALGRAVSGT